MRWLTLLLVLGLSPSSACGAGSDLSSLSNEQLIDRLQEIDKPVPGLNGMGVYDGFIADDEAPDFMMGVLGAPKPNIPSEMKELVRRGADALPALLKHLDDRRPTKFEAGGDFFMAQEFSNEYAPRHPQPTEQCPEACQREKLRNTRFFEGKYTAKVGDVCYGLVGQIVGRHLDAIRYQPTGILIVNSPIETPELAARASEDWAGLDRKTHKDSLLADLEREGDLSRFAPALTRLRFYYPDAYRALQGGASKKRREFEVAEEEAKRRKGK